MDAKTLSFPKLCKYEPILENKFPIAEGSTISAFIILIGSIAKNLIIPNTRSGTIELPTNSI